MGSHTHSARALIQTLTPAATLLRCISQVRSGCPVEQGAAKRARRAAAPLRTHHVGAPQLKLQAADTLVTQLQLTLQRTDLVLGREGQ